LTEHCYNDIVTLLKEQGERCSMSLGIAFKGPEGIVLAADSRVTLMAQLPGQLPGQSLVVPATYDNATKLLRVKCQTHIGAITYGVGALGLQEFRTANSLMPEFEDYLRSEPSVQKDKNGAVARLRVEEFATHLSSFFQSQWKNRMPPPPPNVQILDIAFLVGGYDENEPYGKVFEFQVPTRPNPRETLPRIFGLTWGGQREFVDRLLRGYDDRLPIMAQQFLHLNDSQRDGLIQHFTNTLGVPIPYQFLPLQDCVDLSVFLIRITMGIQYWFMGLRGVGGEIDVATIKRIEGLEAIKEKKITGGD